MGTGVPSPSASVKKADSASRTVGRRRTFARNSRASLERSAAPPRSPLRGVEPGSLPWAAGLTSPTGREELFDRAALLSILDHDTQAYADVLTAFLDDAPQTMSALREAVRVNDAGSLAFLAHKMRGSFASVFARREARAAAALERIAAENGAGEARNAIRALDVRLGALIRALRAELAGAPSGVPTTLVFATRWARE